MTRKHGKFTKLASEAEKKKESALKEGNNGMIPHDLWNRIIPITREYNRGTPDIALLYSYLISRVNGESGNDRYMSAFPNVETIAKHTGIGRNRVTPLVEILEFTGMLKTVYDYTANKRDKLYYPQYYSDVPNEVIHEKMTEWVEKYT